MKQATYWVVVAVLQAFCWAPPCAFAQAPARPSRGVFEGATADPSTRETLSLSVSAAEAYDDNLQADAAGQPGSPIFQTSGFFTSLAPAVTFESRGNHVQVSATAASNLRYYGDLHELVALNHSVGAGVSAQLGRPTTLFVNQAISYAPAYLYGLFATNAVPAAGDVIPPATDYALNNERSYAYATTAGLNHELTRRATLSFNSNIRYTDFVGSAPGFFDLHAYDAGGRLTYALNRDIRLRLGYVYRQAQYFQAREAIEHNLDIGLEYSRRLSRSRRTTMALSIGPTVAKGSQNVALPPTARQYRLVADALLDHQIGQTWSAHGSFHRGFGYIEGLPNPVFTNAATLAAGGFFNRRTDLAASAAYSAGDSSLSGTPSPFTTYTGDIRLRVAVTGRLATYVEYVYYYYDFNRNLLLPPGIPRGLTRNGVRAGLMLWVPLMMRRH